MAKLKWVVASLFVLGTVAGLVARPDVPTIDEIMTKAHAARKGLRAQIKDAVEKGKPDYTDLAKKSKEFVDLANALEKNAAPKGDKAGWVKLSKDYAGMVKELDTAVGKKDDKGVLAAIKKLDANCMDCHDQFRD